MIEGSELGCTGLGRSLVPAGLRLGGGWGNIVARVNSLLITTDNSVAGAGTGALDDAAGTSGRMRAEGFIKAGATMQAQNLTANITWKCP